MIDFAWLLSRTLTRALLRDWLGGGGGGWGRFLCSAPESRQGLGHERPSSRPGLGWAGTGLGGRGGGCCGGGGGLFIRGGDSGLGSLGRHGGLV